MVFLYTTPFFVALGSHVILGERLRALQWGGLGLSFAGVALAIGVPQANVDAKVLYPPSKAAVCRYGEMLANELAGRIPVFFFSPGLVRTQMTDSFSEDAPWTPPELAPELVRKLATGRYDALAGRYLHAEHDDVDDLLARIDEVRERDLNAIRLRR